MKITEVSLFNIVDCDNEVIIDESILFMHEDFIDVFMCYTLNTIRTEFNKRVFEESYARLFPSNYNHKNRSEQYKPSKQQRTLSSDEKVVARNKRRCLNPWNIPSVATFDKVRLRPTRDEFNVTHSTQSNRLDVSPTKCVHIFIDR